MNESTFLQAFKGTNEQVPVWFMRQAGRYLPEYRKIKEKYSLQEMFTQPELAAEITCQPIPILNVDAAILFADILTLPGAMGFDIHFDNQTGPAISNPLRKSADLKNIHDFENLKHVTQSIKLVKAKLKDKVPLIGFAGSPFSVATYLIEGGSSLNHARTIRFMYEEKDAFHTLMKILTKNTVRYLKLQQEAGIDVYQIFDTWAGILRPADFSTFVLPYVTEIFKEVKGPSIYFLKNTNYLLSLIEKIPADFLSVDQTVVLGHHPILKTTKKGIQGNLFNGLLYTDQSLLKREVLDVLKGAAFHKKYIFNLSHGVFPDVNVDSLKFIVDCVHAFPWKIQKSR